MVKGLNPLNRSNGSDLLEIFIRDFGCDVSLNPLNRSNGSDKMPNTVKEFDLARLNPLNRSNGSDPNQHLKRSRIQLPS